jgi:hypothetical protein
MAIRKYGNPAGLNVDICTSPIEKGESNSFDYSAQAYNVYENYGCLKKKTNT